MILDRSEETRVVVTCNFTLDGRNPAKNFGALGCGPTGTRKAQSQCCPLLLSRDRGKAKGGEHGKWIGWQDVIWLDYFKKQVGL